MSYERFAYLYDELMKDVPYDNWVNLTEAYKQKFQVEGTRLLDLACGTGELSVRFAQKGYEVTGADLSDDMLSVAQRKAQTRSLPIQFFQQDMTELDDLGEFDIIGIYCDSLNYNSFFLPYGRHEQPHRQYQLEPILLHRTLPFSLPYSLVLLPFPWLCQRA